jgi:hypothetical protein
MAERTKLNGTSVKLNSTETSKDALGESVSEVMSKFNLSGQVKPYQEPFFIATNEFAKCLHV